MTQGFSQNNPSNLMQGPVWYQGEITPTNTIGIRNFSSLQYGIRAWLVNLFYQIGVNGLNTYGAYLNAYAPVSGGNQATYPSNVCSYTTGIGYTGNPFNLGDTIATDSASLEQLFFAQIHYEISPDDAQIQDIDFQNGYDLFTGSIDGSALNAAVSISPDNTVFIILCIIAIIGLIILILKLNKML